MKRLQLKNLIEQSYSVFNIYSKSADDTKNILNAFASVLENKSTQTITKAFKEWLTSEENFPTPAKIYAKCERIDAQANKPNYGPAVPAPKPQRSSKAVSWAFKYWNDFTEEDKRGLAKHLREMPKDKAGDYLKYLKHYCHMDKEAYAKAVNFLK